MWKVLRSLSGKGKMSGVLTRCVNCNSIFAHSKDQFKIIISRNYTVSCMRMANESLEHKSGVPSKPKRTYQSSNQDSEGRIPAGGWLLLIIPVSTLGLGIWQVYRWRWKLGLIEEMRLKSITDPVPLPQDESEIGDLEYRKVKVRGKFDYSKEILIGPRSLVVYDDRSGDRSRGLFSSGSSNNGYNVITPFKLEGRNERILINRGWISSRNTSKFKHTDETVELVGIVRRTENRAPFMNKNIPGQNLLHYRDVGHMAPLLNSKEVFLDLYSIEGVDFSQARQNSIPVPRQTRVTLRNEHVSYFVTWFSLSAITSLMWHRRFIRGLYLL